MDRRAFVRSVLTAAAAGAVFDVDKALWVPGGKSFLLPDPPAWFSPGPSFDICDVWVDPDGTRRIARMVARSDGITWHASYIVRADDADAVRVATALAGGATVVMGRGTLRPT
jgi:hypothetical protein